MHKMSIIKTKLETPRRVLGGMFSLARSDLARLMRILGKANIRVVYVTLQEDSILLVHGFLKKTQKTSNKELNIALVRFKDYKTSS